MAFYCYMRISTKEEKGKQKFTRQEGALVKWCKENNVEISERKIYKDDASGKNFERPAWRELEQDVKPGDTIVFKDICRFTRECENGLKKYMALMSNGVNLVFIDNYTLSTDYIKALSNVNDAQDRVLSLTMDFIVKLLLTVELDRAEKERENIVKRIKDGIQASSKESGRKKGTLDKMTPELDADIKMYLSDRSIKQIDLMKKHNVSRNTLKKYIEKYIDSVTKNKE